MRCARLARLFSSTQHIWSGGSGHSRPCSLRFRKVLPAAVCWHSTAPESVPHSWVLHEDHFEFKYADSCARFDYIWLRDHCRSTTCYNLKTNQRMLDTSSVELDIKPTNVRTDEDSIYFTWPDGHRTKYGLEWLYKHSYEAQKDKVIQPRVLWNVEIYNQAKVRSTPMKEFMETDEGVKAFLKNFLLYGIAFVVDVPATMEATEEVAKRVSFISYFQDLHGCWTSFSQFSMTPSSTLGQFTFPKQKSKPSYGDVFRPTIFGTMWTFTSDYSRGDTAYTKIALDRHTDTTYFQEPCGMQVFHCLEHSGTGGRTLLVDGFYAAEQLRKHHPEDFHLLTTVPLKHEYIEQTHTCSNHMIGVGPVLSTYPWNNELYMLRYNNYDRAVITTVPHDVVHRWYLAHRTLTTEMRKSENELWVKLKPGMALFVDNWRVLHGRESFNGYRQLCGCYLTRDDVLNAARLLGLQA